ncbi:Mo-dependent nitrogenase C-terminal domain-containing protein [Chroococcidiopsis sp [FACHB-1243]]|uniref:Mo-dependent nitrogenase C-terminal domain-containing protein n=1 Tax=Chroococcidiopsis sp. [FACHB-1243] TaxID=2692781 RepID=UPI001F557DE1|nr:Mo-dependent nitrogenase C-terminal domain-containing protein [Chroococcidiopsis sp. [FACHB-1243]]
MMMKLVNLKELVCFWLDGIEIRDSKKAHLLCKAIPSSCPFEREIKFFNRILVHIPPLCKLLTRAGIS